MGKVLDSIVKEWKEKGLDDDPFFNLLVEMPTYYADDSEFDSVLERVITEAPLCTCKSVLNDLFDGPQPEDVHLIGAGYRGSHPLLHEENCPLHTGNPLIIDDTVT